MYCISSLNIGTDNTINQNMFPYKCKVGVIVKTVFVLFNMLVYCVCTYV